MEAIAARWEWRHFYEALEPAEALIRELGGEARLRESEEIYIVSRASGDNIKVRHGRLDIKERIRVDARGLEQWRPRLKSGFPLPPDVLGALQEIWGVSLDLDAGPVDLESLVQAAGRRGELVAVEVAKQRYGYSIEGTAVEIAALSVDGRPIRTICVEHADPDRVHRLLARLGLADLENTSYVLALKRLLGWA
ncbi:MAG: hypothetical protein JXR96_13360 [Deltaproteobacteria bacterium]|nr:hypothetical protein [Deltaproteobacteria bacterium]